MGKIKKILENELVGGTQTTDVYPVTSTKAVYDTNNKVLDDTITELNSTINTINKNSAEYNVTLTNSDLYIGALITEKGKVSGRNNHAYSLEKFDIFDGFVIKKDTTSPNADNLKCVVGFYDIDESYINQQDISGDEVIYDTRLYIGDVFNGKLKVPDNARYVRLRDIYRADSDGKLLPIGTVDGAITIESLKSVREELFSLSDDIESNKENIEQQSSTIQEHTTKLQNIIPVTVSEGQTSSIIGNFSKYLSVEIKSDFEISQIILKGYENKVFTSEDQPVGTWVRYSSVGAVGAKCSLSFAFADGQKHPIEYRKLVKLNSDSIFGADNPLSKDALDKLFADVPNSGEFYISLYTGLTIPPSEIRGVRQDTFTKAEVIGNISISSSPNVSWEGWKEIGTYGQSRIASIPIYNKVHGALECDSQLSVLPLWSCWSQNASGSNNYNGGHILHGWTTDRKKRITITQNIYRDDEASIFNYIPGDKTEGGEGVFQRLRLGCDNLEHGMLIEPVYPNGYSGGYWHRISLIGGRFRAITNNICPPPTSATDTGLQGEFTFDENYMYYCVADNQWKRITLEDW